MAVNVFSSLTFLQKEYIHCIAYISHLTRFVSA